MTRMFESDSEKNDLVIGSDGNLSIVRGINAVKQAAQQAAQAQLGEMILAVDEGVANTETIWSKSTNVAQFEAYVRRAILNVAGVTEIRDFSVQIADNEASYIATIVTIFGQTQVSGTQNG